MPPGEFDVRHWFLRIGLILVSTLHPPITGTSYLYSDEYQTKHVFLVVIDGVRNDEAFEDSLHQFIPRMWNDLRPLGTLYTNFYSTCITYTTSGHVTLLTGNRNNLPNADNIPCEPFRPRFPTIFEYYRKSNNNPQDDVWMVVGKGNLSTINCSQFPGYGLQYAASMQYDLGNDSTTIAAFHDVMDQLHPSLALLNLEDVDVMGHLGLWERYTAAISYADSLVWDLWQRIESDPYYQGKTTIFITTDHGRHDDQHGGFSDHGGTDHGSQHSFLLAVGPDIKQDTVITHRRDLIDIAPTVGELLKFKTHFAMGTVMSEMINTPPRRVDMNLDYIGDAYENAPATRITFTNSMSLSPSVAKSPSYIHLIWTESDSLSIPEKKRIMYSRKDMIYGYWSDPIPLFEDIDSNTVFQNGEILRIVDDGLAVVARALFEIPDSLGKATYKWKPISSISPNGDSWSETIIFDNFANGSRDIIPSSPCVYSSDGILTTCWITGDRWVVIKRSTDGGNSFFSLVNWRPQVAENKLQLFSPSLTENEFGLASILECNLYHHSRILFGTLDAILEDPTGIFILDEGKEPSFYPMVRATASKLHFTWSDLAESNWQVYYRSSLPDGSFPSEIINLSNSPVAAFHPCLESRGDSLVIAWEDFRDGNPEIFAAMSTDDGVHWENATRITFTPGNSINPALEFYENFISILWQDDSDGNWEIYYVELPVSTLLPR